LVAPIVGELHVDAEITALQKSDDLLKSVAVFSAYADGIALDRSLHFFLRVLDDANDLFGFFRGNSLLHGDLLALPRAGSSLNGSVGERLERYAAFDQLTLQNIIHRFEFIFVGGAQDDRVFPFQRDL